MQIFQIETKIAAKTCVLRQATLALRSTEPGQTYYIKPKSMKTVVGLTIAQDV